MKQVSFVPAFSRIFASSTKIGCAEGIIAIMGRNNIALGLSHGLQNPPLS